MPFTKTHTVVPRDNVTAGHGQLEAQLKRGEHLSDPRVMSLLMSKGYTGETIMSDEDWEYLLTHRDGAPASLAEHLRNALFFWKLIGQSPDSPLSDPFFYEGRPEYEGRPIPDQVLSVIKAVGLVGPTANMTGSTRPREGTPWWYYLESHRDRVTVDKLPEWVVNRFGVLAYPSKWRPTENQVALHDKLQAAVKSWGKGTGTKAEAQEAYSAWLKACTPPAGTPDVPNPDISPAECVAAGRRVEQAIVSGNPSDAWKLLALTARACGDPTYLDYSFNTNPINFEAL